MEKIQEVKGLGGMLNGFRDLVKDDQKIIFVGSPGFCTPFALIPGLSSARKGRWPSFPALIVKSQEAGCHGIGDGVGREVQL